MTTISPQIQPLPKLHTGEGTGPKERTFTFEDVSTTIYPKLPSGQSIRVVIIRRRLTTNTGTVFHVCRNSGKWSFRIDYAYKDKTTRLTRTAWLKELHRMGGLSYGVMMLAGAS
jgi:hypothetical protein